MNLKENQDIKAINWNRIEDDMDMQVWTRMTNNFWLDTRIPLSNDRNTWATLNDHERLATTRVFIGLTLLDTLQSRTGPLSLIEDASSDHEISNLTFIASMECIHAKSYSSIFSTLLSTKEIDDAYRWSEENPYLQKKKELILKYYRQDCPYRKKITSVMLESFLFYSGFYLPFYWASKAKLTNTADIIRLILRDEAIHGSYIGYKFKQRFKDLDEAKREELRSFTYDFLQDLYDNEVGYTQDLYDELGLTEDVKIYLHYNANKALSNLGFEPLFPDHLCQVHPSILSAISLESETHDFFSGVGSSYVIGQVESTNDTDWDF